MSGHGEKGIAILILILIALYLFFKKGFTVSSSLAGQPIPQSAKTLTPAGAAAFGFSSPANPPQIETYTPSTPPDITSSTGYAGAFPLSYSTPDQSGLTQADHEILRSTYV